LFAATVREVGPGRNSHQYTGRAIVIPHSLLLTNPLVNHAYMGEYMVHIITIPWSLKNDWVRAEKLLMEAAEAECAAFVAEARRHMERLATRQGLEPISVEPRITVE